MSAAAGRRLAFIPATMQCTSNPPTPTTISLTPVRTSVYTTQVFGWLDLPEPVSLSVCLYAWCGQQTKFLDQLQIHHQGWCRQWTASCSTVRAQRALLRLDTPPPCPSTRSANTHARAHKNGRSAIVCVHGFRCAVRCQGEQPQQWRRPVHHEVFRPKPRPRHVRRRVG